MKYEIDMARAQHIFFSIPQRSKPDEPPVTADEVIARRRSLRMVTDGLIHTAFLNGDVVQLMEAIVETMTATAGTCVQFGIEPDISDFLLAGKDLVEDARVLLDKAILVREYDQVKIGAAMLQCVCAGVCGILGLPYKDAMAMAHSRYLDADKPSREDFEALLEARGFKLNEEASNDESEAA
jgi:hypothetical protein